MNNSNEKGRPATAAPQESFEYYRLLRRAEQAIRAEARRRGLPGDPMSPVRLGTDRATFAALDLFWSLPVEFRRCDGTWPMCQAAATARSGRADP